MWIHRKPKLPKTTHFLAYHMFLFKLSLDTSLNYLNKEPCFKVKYLLQQCLEKILTKGSRLSNQISFQKGLGNLPLNSVVACNSKVSYLLKPELWPSGRTSASQSVGRRFKPWPSHTKDFKNSTHCLLVWRLTYENEVGKVKHAELPVDQPPTVAFTAFADVWPRAKEMEIGATLCTIGRRKGLWLWLIS